MHSPADAAPSHLYVPELSGEGATISLSETESHYLMHVCRARAGDVAHATDGNGALAVLRIVAGGKRAEAKVESLERAERQRRAWVLCGPPEGQRADWLVEKLAELGIEAWQPLATKRGEWHGGAGRRERWERLAIAALRQSRRRFLMDVRDPIPLGDAIASLPDSSARWIARQDGERGLLPPGGAGTSIGAIGPGSGFTDRESEAFDRAGFRPACFADGRLRTETAALAWAVWWSLGV